MKPKYFAGIILILLGVFMIYSTTITNVSCTGWQIINPICHLRATWDFITDTLGWIFGIAFVFFGALMFIINQENAKWFIASIILAVVAIILIIVSPGVPFDELAFGIASIGSTVIGLLKTGGSSNSGLEFF